MDAETILKKSENQTGRGIFLSIFKKVTIVAIATTISTTAYAQEVDRTISVGAQAGVNFSKLSGWLTNLIETNGEIDVNMKPGFQLGVYLEQPMRNPNFAWQYEAMFSQLGTKMEDNYTAWGGRQVREVGTINMNCLFLRLHIQYNYAFTHDLALQLHTGIHGAYVLWANTKYERFENGQKVSGESEAFFGDTSGRGADFGIGLGAALLIQDRFRVGVGYDLGVVFHNLSFSLTYMFGR